MCVRKVLPISPCSIRLETMSHKQMIASFICFFLCLFSGESSRALLMFPCTFLSHPKLHTESLQGCDVARQHMGDSGELRLVLR